MQNDDIEIFPKDEEEATKLVREFIRKTRRFEWIVNTEKANNIFLPENNLTTSRIYRKPPESLGTVLASSLEYYRNIVSVIEKGHQAKIVAKWINYALDQGVISEGQGITGRLEDCEKENKRLEGEITSLENQLTLVSNKNKKLEAEKKTYKQTEKELKEKN